MKESASDQPSWQKTIDNIYKLVMVQLMMQMILLNYYLLKSKFLNTYVKQASCKL